MEINSVTANFANGTSEHADILVGADGVRSTVRTLLAPQIKPQFAGYVGWRCLAAESAFAAPVHEKYFDRFCFHYPAGEQVLSYPVAGVNNDLRKGHRRLNVVWYRPVHDDEMFRRMLTSDDGTYYAAGIPPPLIAADILAQAKNAACQLPEPFRIAVATTDQFFFQPIHDVISDLLSFGRVVLAGDAAFTARPHVGAGVTKAAADAAALALQLEQCRVRLNFSVSDALANYEQTRLDAGRRIIRETQRLGRGIASGSDHMPVEVMLENMADTATLNFLR